MNEPGTYEARLRRTVGRKIAIGRALSIIALAVLVGLCVMSYLGRFAHVTHR
jgi:hypothetical protein